MATYAHKLRLLRQSRSRNNGVSEETMLGNLNGWHALIVIVVILLLFGAPKIPQLARSVGQSIKILKTESRGDAGVSARAGASAPQLAVSDADTGA